MSSLRELLDKQTKIINSMNRALPNFKRLGPAKMTAGCTRNRIAKLKALFSECRVLDARIVTYADADAKARHPYFVHNLFEEAEKKCEEALDFMSEVLEKRSPLTFTGSRATANYGKSMGGTYMQHKTIDSTQRLSMYAIGNQSCQTRAQAISSYAQEVQDSASHDSLKRKQTNRICTNPRKKVRFNGDYISIADFGLNLVALNDANIRDWTPGQDIDWEGLERSKSLRTQCTDGYKTSDRQNSSFRNRQNNIT